MDKQILTDYDIIRENLGNAFPEYKDGDYLITAVPMHQDSPPLITKDGVTVGSDAEWHRVPWENIIGTYSKPAAPQSDTGEDDNETQR